MGNREINRPAIFLQPIILKCSSCLCVSLGEGNRKTLDSIFTWTLVFGTIGKLFEFRFWNGWGRFVGVETEENDQFWEKVSQILTKTPPTYNRLKESFWISNVSNSKEIVRVQFEIVMLKRFFFSMNNSGHFNAAFESRIRPFNARHIPFLNVLLKF